MSNILDLFINTKTLFINLFILKIQEIMLLIINFFVILCNIIVLELSNIFNTFNKKLYNIDTTTLRISFNPEHELYLQSLYGEKKLSNQYISDIGFDLYLPTDIIIQPRETIFINLGIKAEYQSDLNNTYYGYQLYPRSSISKTKLRLANSVGIIDPNYRGYLIAAVDNISDQIQYLKKGERYFQLCFVKLKNPDRIEIISESKLSTTDRNQNGFGSTGK
jgi:dUTP pyrophosphatase